MIPAVHSSLAIMKLPSENFKWVVCVCLYAGNEERAAGSSVSEDRDTLAAALVASRYREILMTRKGY